MQNSKWLNFTFRIWIYPTDNKVISNKKYLCAYTCTFTASSDTTLPHFFFFTLNSISNSFKTHAKSASPPRFPGFSRWHVLKIAMKIQWRKQVTPRNVKICRVISPVAESFDKWPIYRVHGQVSKADISPLKEIYLGLYLLDLSIAPCRSEGAPWFMGRGLDMAGVRLAITGRACSSTLGSLGSWLHVRG